MSNNLILICIPLLEKSR